MKESCEFNYCQPWFPGIGFGPVWDKVVDLGDAKNRGGDRRGVDCASVFIRPARTAQTIVQTDHVGRCLRRMQGDVDGELVIAFISCRLGCCDVLWPAGMIWEAFVAGGTGWYSSP